LAAKEISEIVAGAKAKGVSEKETEA